VLKSLKSLKFSLYRRIDYLDPRLLDLCWTSTGLRSQRIPVFPRMDGRFPPNVLGVNGL
jgi:hypothetical protein